MLLFNQFAMSQGGEWWCNVPSQPEPFRYIRTGDFNSTYNPKLFALVHHIESRQIIFQDEFDTLRPLCYTNTVQQHFSAAGWQNIPDICHGRHGHVRVIFFGQCKFLQI